MEAVRELQDLRLGRVVVGANEGAVHVLLPVIERFREEHPQAQVDVRRVAARQMASEVLRRTLDFGVVTFAPRERGIRTLSLGDDELVLLIQPTHPLAKRSQVTMEEVGRQTVIAHNDPSPARERVLQLYERRHASINIQMSLPSLDVIKRAVEMGLGVAIFLVVARSRRSGTGNWPPCRCRSCGSHEACGSSTGVAGRCPTPPKPSWRPPRAKWRKRRVRGPDGDRSGNK